jgi:hypothetical protein
MITGNTIRLGWAICALLVARAPALAQGPGNAITIYSTATAGAVSPELYRPGSRSQPVPGYAVVRHQRELALARGKNTVRVSDVAALIDPTTVSFESLTDRPGTRVIEQNFQFDLVSSDKLLQKYIDREISVDQTRGNSVETFTGTLLSTSGGLTLQGKDGTLQILPANSAVKLPGLPGGLITRPTLVWDVEAQRAGTHNTRVSYQTGGMTWWADYNLTFAEGSDANSCQLDVAAWVSLLNQSGASYTDARLKLVAGDVQRAPPARAPNVAMRPQALARSAVEQGFEEKAFFEYHLYTLGRPATLPDNSTQQIELFPAARSVPCTKTLVYYGLDPGYRVYGATPLTDRNYGTQSNRKVDVYLGFKNAQANNMGMPLPSGRVRVSKLDPADGTLEFIGEDVIDHTPRNEQLLIKLGSAFDVVGERRQLDFRLDTERKTLSEDIEIKLRNRKSEAVSVVVKENLYRWANWQISARTHAFEKQDARTVHFPLRVAADSEVTLRYTVQYSW